MTAANNNINNNNNQQQESSATRTNNHHRNNDLFLLIHTMTITECDYIVQAQFFHTFVNDLAHVNNAQLVARRISIRLHPMLRGTRQRRHKRNLYCLDIRSLMKRNPANIRHHLRTVHIGPQTNHPSAVLQNQMVAEIKGAVVTSPNKCQQQPMPAAIPALDNNSASTTVEKALLVVNDNINVVNNTNNNNNNNQIYASSSNTDQLMPTASPQHIIAWLTRNRFVEYLATFRNFSGTDMMRMTKDDFIQICGQANGIRLYNAVHLSAPKLIYFCRENATVFNAVYLSTYTNQELLMKLAALIGLPSDQIRDIYLEGPHAIHVQLNNELIGQFKEEEMFIIKILNENSGGGGVVLLLKDYIK